VLGPFLAAVPVAVQITGVSDPDLVVPLCRLATCFDERDVWIVSNSFGVDEMIGFGDNWVNPPPRSGVATTLVPVGSLTPGTGTLADLLPDATRTRADQFLDLIAGRVNETATDAVALNAASLAVASRRGREWNEAFTSAQDAIRDGAALDLVHRMRARHAHPSRPSRHQRAVVDA
jgi:anthranilate phosphoribosyltransferase